MKLLYASERPPFPFFLGGAARSAHYLMTILARDFNVDCLAVGSKDFKGSHWATPIEADYPALGIMEVAQLRGRTSIQCGYKVQVDEDFGNSLARIIDEFAPDVVWTQLDGVEEVARIAQGKGVQVLVYLRDAEDPPTSLKALVAAGCCIVCNSQFMAQRLKKITQKSAHVIYPSLESSFGVMGDPKGYITMINPFRVKGVDTFLAIARRMPEQRFLMVESWTLNDTAHQSLLKQIADLPNVVFSRRVSDVSEIYRKTRLMLVPSVWEEAFGRVVIEAQSCGIPVIASQRGGIPEAVGVGGVCISDYLNPEIWETEIRRVLDDNDLYEDLSRLALSHATGEQFTTRYAAAKFYQICSDSSNFSATKNTSLARYLSAFVNYFRFAK